MPLTQEQKQEALGAIEETLDGANTVYLTDYQGLTVEQATGLRRAFRKADVEFKVLKNTLLRRAMENQGGFDDLLDQLNGPTAVAFTNDPAGPAKVLKKFLEDNDLEVPRFKGAYIDGAIYGGNRSTCSPSSRARTSSSPTSSGCSSPRSRTSRRRSARRALAWPASSSRSPRRRRPSASPGPARHLTPLGHSAEAGTLIHNQRRSSHPGTDRRRNTPTPWQTSTASPRASST